MEVVSSRLGFVIKYESTSEIKTHIRHLRMLLKNIETGEVSPDPPHLYCAHTDVPAETLLDWMTEVKGASEPIRLAKVE